MTAAYFKQAYYSLHPKLYRVAFSILKNTENAEDIVQDVYCKLWDERDKLVDIQKPEAYCVTLIKNLCMDFFRSSKATLYEQRIETDEFPDDTSNAETDIIYKETIEKVNSLLLLLPEKQQRVIDLRIFADCSSEEIEKITGNSAENVRVLLSRARNTLKTKLKKIRI